MKNKTANNMCSVEAYFQLFKEQKIRLLNEAEIAQMNQFQMYLQLSTDERFQPFFSENTKKALNHISNYCLAHFDDPIIGIEAQRIYGLSQPKTKALESGKVRTLVKEDDAHNKRAGYINASILLYAILNIGVIAAVVMILMKNL